ncbi:MAG: peptidylprolyl isomerase [Planctomycetota bacterium]
MLSATRRCWLSLAVVAALGTTGAEAQVVEFETNQPGTSFLVELNPTDDPNLQGLVDNFLLYVTSNLYDGVVINRAVEDFVVQMGSFTTSTLDPASVNGNTFTSISTFAPVVVDGDNNGLVDFPTLSNTRGTISLALNATGPNSGTSSFFVNLDDNGFLDGQGFVPFARIVNIAPINAINSATRVDLSQEVGASGSLTFIDFPVFGDPEELLVIERAVVIPEPAGLLTVTLGMMAAAARRR